ncbi:glycosyltransferase [Cytophagaceae bacterium ABcell3]|nr:glycosyltransferase [Cytophagaceae bacterium ABcell3]
MNLDKIRHVNIAVCADLNMEIGLHVALYSCLKYINQNAFVIFNLFLKDYTSLHINSLHTSLKPFCDRYKFNVFDADQIETGNGIGLHGNKMPYLIINVPHYVESDKVLCIDADMVVKTDLSTLFEEDLENSVAGVVHGTKVNSCWNKEKNFLLSLGLSGESVYFNTGVVLININEWKKRSVTERCLKLASEYPNDLHTADQTLLNAVINNEVKIISSHYNIHCYPLGKALETEAAPGVYHFLGSPKPWEMGSEFLHPNYQWFKSFLDQTSKKGYKSWHTLSYQKLKRLYKIKGSYFRMVKSRFKTNRS